jgi:hypothetical protein
MTRARSLVLALLFGALAAAPAAAKDPPPPSTKEIPHFSHQSHAKLPQFKDAIAKERARGVVASGATDADFLPCAECHALDAKTGEPLPPGKEGHQPCASSSCHGAQMGKVDLHGPATLCRECHEVAEPWQASAPRFVHREEEVREFGWRINHRRHLSVPGLEKCETCHKITKAVVNDEVTVAVHAPAHADCAPCHGKSGSKPSLTMCNSCHLVGEAPKPRSSMAGAFRVYEKFTHETHRLDVRTAQKKPGGMGRGWSLYDRATAQPLGCGACHTTAARSESISDMNLLGTCAMNKTCEGQCHNGKLAFGGGMNDCFMCHSKEAEKATPPASHCGS